MRYPRYPQHAHTRTPACALVAVTQAHGSSVPPQRHWPDAFPLPPAYTPPRPASPLSPRSAPPPCTQGWSLQFEDLVLGMSVSPTFLTRLRQQLGHREEPPGHRAQSWWPWDPLFDLEGCAPPPTRRTTSEQSCHVCRPPRAFFLFYPGPDRWWENRVVCIEPLNPKRHAIAAAGFGLITRRFGAQSTS